MSAKILHIKNDHRQPTGIEEEDIGPPLKKITARQQKKEQLMQMLESKFRRRYPLS